MVILTAWGHIDMLILDRRDFVRFFSVLAAGLVFPNCSRAKDAKRLLENEDKEGFYVRFIRPMKPINRATWRLQAGGLCENPKAWTLEELKKLTRETQVSRMKCVESWSSKAKWGGFRARAFFDAAKPKKEAKYLSVQCADGYYESYLLDDLLTPRILFVYEMDGKPLPDDHGGPFRLIVPAKYGYKSAKSIVTMDFVDRKRVGYWVENGYSDDATIQPGTDYALDLKTYKLIKQPGEPDY
jgi:DMSO/TMAO reductase YedYZ molybdopterin-dependent catalytic subunit